MTIPEIAKKAGVSIATVDRVLHKRGRVSDKTIKKIQEIIDTYGYEPNPFARNLKLNRRYLIGILVPNPQTRSVHGYWEDICNGCMDAKKEFNSDAVQLVFQFYENTIAGSLLESGKKLIAKQVDGIVLSPLLSDEATELIALLGSTPYAIIDAILPGAKPIIDTTQNPYLAGLTAGRMLQMINPNCRRILSLWGWSTSCSLVEKKRGFNDAFGKEIENLQLVLDEKKPMEPYIFDYLKTHAPVDGVFVLHSQSELLVRALDKLNPKKRPTIVGFDTTPLNIRLLEEGKIDCLISQDPYQQGYDAVKKMCLFVIYKNTKFEEQHAPVRIIIKENLKSYSFPNSILNKEDFQ